LTAIILRRENLRKYDDLQILIAFEVILCHSKIYIYGKCMHDLFYGGRKIAFWFYPV